jgi:hypothetical protein
MISIKDTTVRGRSVTMIEEVTTYYYTMSIMGAIGLLLFIPLTVKAFRDDFGGFLHDYGRSTLPLILIPLLAMFILGLTVPDRDYRVIGKAVSAVTTMNKIETEDTEERNNQYRTTMRIEGMDGQRFSVLSGHYIGKDVYMEIVELSCDAHEVSINQSPMECELVRITTP